MTFEAQIVLRGSNPQQLADDVQAVSEFLERRRRSKVATACEQTLAAKRHLELVER